MAAVRITSWTHSLAQGPTPSCCEGRCQRGAAMRVTLQGVTKVVRGQTHLYGIDLDLASGSFNVLLGPTQAGKTSLLRLMAGLDHPSSGRVLEDCTDVT